MIAQALIEKAIITIYKPAELTVLSFQNVVYLSFGINPNKVMIKVSSQAKEKVVQMMQNDGVDIASHFVRVGVKSGGCSGLSYELKFDASLGEDDKIFEDNDVRIVVDKKSFLYLVGTTLEYSGGLNGKGFVFNNPNANRTCGCGESFSL